MNANATYAICGAPLLATAVLLLATARTWRTRRLMVEIVGLVMGFAFAAAVLAPLPPVVFRALLPLACIRAAWAACAHAEWRFAPDCGQSGFAWAWPAAAGRTALLALGAALLVSPVAWFPGLRCDAFPTLAFP
jgi:hypothetical protein